MDFVIRSALSIPITFIIAQIIGYYYCKTKDHLNKNKHQ